MATINIDSPTYNKAENTCDFQEGDHLGLPGSDLTYYRRFLLEEEAEILFNSILSETKWKQDFIKLFGKKVQVPRLTAWCGDSSIVYSYSGLQLISSPWTNSLLTIKNRIQSLLNEEFNSVLLNLYRDENDSVSWHSDNEKELGENPVIASVSLGEARKFQLKHKFIKKLNYTLLIENGSLLVMRGETQHNWLHCVPKSRQKKHPRINLTFRLIK